MNLTYQLRKTFIELLLDSYGIGTKAYNAYLEILKDLGIEKFDDIIEKVHYFNGRFYIYDLGMLKP